MRRAFRHVPIAEQPPHPGDAIDPDSELDMAMQQSPECTCEII
jgi:hypothetical protein